MLKKAMIMAAGVGSRLEPLSFAVPKPLVPLANKPVMDILVTQLISAGIKDIIANTYYKSEDIQNHFNNSNYGANFTFIKEEKLSGTAGGVRKCMFFFYPDEDFIVLSGDGLSDLNIQEVYESHKKSGSIVTIVTKKVDSSEVSKYGIIVTDNNGFVKSFQEKPALSEAKSNLANTGIYIFNYKIFEFIPENTFYDFAKNVFPCIMAAGIKINTYEHSGYWSDIGSLNQYIQSNIDIINNKIKHCSNNVINTEEGKYIIGQNTILGKDSVLAGDCIIGCNCKIGSESIIKNSIIWDNVEIKNNVKIEDSIVLSNSVITKSIFNMIAENENSILKERILA